MVGSWFDGSIQRWHSIIRRGRYGAAEAIFLLALVLNQRKCHLNIVGGIWTDDSVNVTTPRSSVAKQVTVLLTIRQVSSAIPTYREKGIRYMLTRNQWEKGHYYSTTVVPGKELSGKIQYDLCSAPPDRVPPYYAPTRDFKHTQLNTVMQTVCFISAITTANTVMQYCIQ